MGLTIRTLGAQTLPCPTWGGRNFFYFEIKCILINIFIDTFRDLIIMWHQGHKYLFIHIGYCTRGLINMALLAPPEGQKIVTNFSIASFPNDAYL